MNTGNCINCGDLATVPVYGGDSTNSPIIGYLCWDCWEEEDIECDEGDEMVLQGE